MILDLGSLTDRVAMCDPAGRPRSGQSLKAVKARTAIVVVARDLLERVFVLEAWAEKCGATRTTEQIFTLLARWQPRRFGVEANAMQQYYAEMLLPEARRRNVHLPLVEVMPATGVDKLWRIRTVLEPLLHAGRLFIQASQIELRAELIGSPSYRTRDLIDALAAAVSELFPARAPAVQVRTERDRLAAYLRGTGAPPAYISQRLARFDREHLTGGHAA